MNILDTIIAQKSKEVIAAKSTVRVAELVKRPLFSKKTLSLTQHLLSKDNTGIIAEFKRQSPSKGVINGHADVVEVTNAYALHGASAISVLTDTTFFGGSLVDLESAQMVQVPLLRKEFIIDEYQIIEAKAYGASIILLIAACLTPKQVKQLAAFAQSLGLEVLLEIHNQSELAHICDEINCVGVNNRNLKTFEVDINTSLQLIDAIVQAKKVPVAESGISSINNIITLREAGFKGFLIGENFMKETNPAIAFAQFVSSLKNAST